MYKFGSASQARLETCHPDIQEILNEAIKIVDFSVLEGTRSEEKQNDLFHKGMSKVKYPNSKHNHRPSLAVDVAPEFVQDRTLGYVNTLGLIQIF